MAPTRTGAGYWLVASDGGIFSFGDARFYGSTGALQLVRPVVGMAATPSGRGYWLVASDGGIFTFGDAHFYGSTGAMRLARPVVGMARTRTGRGYWMVASDGGIFSFGDARFYGSTGALRLVLPVVGMAASVSGRGYWMVAADGGIFSFGDARFSGSATRSLAGQWAIAMAASPDGNGYWIASQWGVVDAAASGHLSVDPNITGGSGGGTVPGGRNCTAPAHSSASETYSVNIDGGLEYWWVNNDAWSGSHGPQTINVCSQSSWYAVSNQPDLGGAVETYPDTEYDVGGRARGTSRTIAQFKSITSTFSEAFPHVSGDEWDAAYDLWTNNWTNETMVWNEWSGNASYWPSQARTALTIGGVPYHFIDNGGELMFFRDAQVKSGSVNLLAVFQWEVAHGYAKSTDVPTQLEYGVEISGTAGRNMTFPMTGLTMSVS